MKTKTIITLIGALNVLQGIGFILGGETLTKQSFPEDMLTGGAVEVGTAMHWPLGVRAYSTSRCISLLFF